MSDKPTRQAYQAHLEAWRLHRGLTQEAVAEKLEVSHTTIGRWERGTMDIPSSRLVALCHLYQVTPQQLLSPPADAAVIERVATLEGIVKGMDKDAYDSLMLLAKRINPAA